MKRGMASKKNKNKLNFEDLFDDDDLYGSSIGTSRSCGGARDNDHTPVRREPREPRITSPRSDAQRAYHAALQGPASIVVCAGPAGTGKTMTAGEYAIKFLEEGRYKRVLLVRPAVSTEDLGYLPGTILEKLEPYLRPLYDVFESFYEKNIFAQMIDRGVVEPCALAYCRGRTFKHAFIIGDEMQNASPDQLKMLITRLGTGSKLVLTGDPEQHDQAYGKMNGLDDFITRWTRYQGANPAVDNVKILQLDRSDIMRHPAIEHVLAAYA